MASRTNSKHIKSKYKYVRGTNWNGSIYWIFKITGETRQTHKTEREAAIAADKYLISTGNKPVNILL